MITYLLPVMIGSTGGHLVGGKRGAVMGGIGTIGVIVGAEIPMFLGSMIMGPLGGLVIKYVDKALEKRIPAGFEMVINNFSLGIAGMLLCLLGFEVIGPAVLIANTFVKECIEALVHAGYLPLLSVINEPAKVLFLNNAIDQGVYYPLGMQQASVNGKSIFFMVASNPGPGLGLLLAFTLFGKGMSKRSAPGAMIIHFLGGIHELYFPYVLMKPLTIIAMIAGGMSGTWMFNLLGVEFYSNNVFGVLGDLTQGFRAIQMLAANDKPHFIIIKNRHYRVLIESERPGQPVPGRKLEDSVVRRSSPIADSGDKAVQSVVPVRCAVAGFSLPHWPFFAGLMGCLRALSRRQQQKSPHRARNTDQRRQFVAGDSARRSRPA